MGVERIEETHPFAFGWDCRSSSTRTLACLYPWSFSSSWGSRPSHVGYTGTKKKSLRIDKNKLFVCRYLIIILGKKVFRLFSKLHFSKTFGRRN